MTALSEAGARRAAAGVALAQIHRARGADKPQSVAGRR